MEGGGTSAHENIYYNGTDNSKSALNGSLSLDMNISLKTKNMHNAKCCNALTLTNPNGSQHISVS